MHAVLNVLLADSGGNVDARGAAASASVARTNGIVTLIATSWASWLGQPFSRPGSVV